MSDYKFQIGGLNIDKLSGPTSVAILTPTKQTQQRSTRKLPVFLFLGDSHVSFNNICDKTTECDSQNKICPSTMSKNWYNLLDSVASQEEPIDYFIESAYILKIINQYNMFSLMWDEDNGMHKPSSVMRYFDKNYLWCFAADPKLNHCFTKHIRYHFADIRKNRDSYESLTMSEFENFDIDEEDGISQNHIDYLLKQLLEANFENKPFVPYEAWLRTGLQYVLQTDKILKIGNKNLIDLLLLSTQSFELFASEFFDETDPFFIQYSQIYKQGKKGNIEQFYGKTLKQFVVNYFKMREKKINMSVKKNIFEHTKQVIIRLIKENQITKENYIRQKFMFATETEVFFRDMYHNNETNFILKWVTWLCSPLMDLYFLLRSWKNIEPKSNRLNNPSWLTIFQGGSSHVETLVSFLIDSKLYEDHCFVGTIKSSSTFQNIDSNQIKVNTDTIPRCIELKCNFDFDIYHNNYNQLQICKQRIKYFGPKRYLELLDGELISENELRKADKKSLKLKSIIIEKDQINNKNHIEKLKKENQT
jgi:hypothetical protein